MATNSKVQPNLNMESNEIQTINTQDSVEEATGTYITKKR